MLLPKIIGYLVGGVVDTIERRFQRIERGLIHIGPEDQHKRPAMLIFHGCGGIGTNLSIYAKACAAQGVRAYLIDSYAARRWSRRMGALFSCNGLRFRGLERSGDVLAAIWGLRQRPEVDADKLVLAGWSHGAWAIMDLMTLSLTRPGEARLANPTSEPLQSVKGLFLMYPYVNFLSRSISRPWHYKPKTLAVLSLKDHLASYHHSVRVIKGLRKQGIDIQTLTFDTTHAFDEPNIGHTGFMRYDADAAKTSIEAMQDFLKDTIGASGQ